MMIHDKLPIASGDECFKLLTYQLAIVNRKLGFDSGKGAFSVVGALSRCWKRSAAEYLLALVLNVVHSQIRVEEALLGLTD